MFENRVLHIIHKLYGWTITVGGNLQSLFLLYMRLVWGHQLFLAGLAKLSNIAPVTEFFTTLHLPHPSMTAHTVAFFETVCGFLLFIGLGSRLAAIPVMVIMVCALSLAHTDAFIQWRFLFEPARLVQQAPYPFLLTAVLVFVFGPGRVSIDAWLKRWANRQAKF